MSLSDKVVVDLAVGAEHTLCVTSDGDVYGWGSNSDGQLGLGHTLTIREPEKISGLSGKGVQQVCIYIFKSKSLNCLFYLFKFYIIRIRFLLDERIVPHGPHQESFVV